jgi:uncharacterized protein YkwD
MRSALLFLIFLVACKGSDENTVQTLLSPATSVHLIGDDTSSDDSPTTIDPSVNQEFMSLIDNHRISLGLTPLIWDEALTEIVQEHSDGMAAGTVAFGHSGFSSRCTEGRAAIGGGNWCGENVAMGQKSQAAAFSAWMNSSGHRANIENARATHTGFAYAKSSGGTIYWTQIFLEQN